MLVFYNGTIRTMDPANPVVDAVLVGNDGRIRAVGSRAEIETSAGDAERIDLQGHTLIPGFNDAHTHVQWLGA